MNRIKELRKNKGVTVKELSEIIGISQSMLSNYENGNSEPRDKETWKKLADYFDVSIPYLMGFENRISIETNNPEDLIEETKKTVNEARKIVNDTIERALEDVALDFSSTSLELIDDVIKNINNVVVDNVKYADDVDLIFNMSDNVDILERTKNLLRKQKEIIEKTTEMYKIYKEILELKKLYDEAHN